MDTKEDGYLDLLGDKGWPKAKIQNKLAGIEGERAEIHTQLADTTNKLDTGRQFFTLALELLSDPQGFYQRGNAAVKKAITKIIFGRIGLDALNPEDQEQEATVASHQLTDGIDGLVEVGSTAGSRYNHTGTPTTDSERGPLPKERASPNLRTGADLLATVFLDQGSSKAAMVELRGFEPLTP